MKKESLQDSIRRLEHECEVGLPHDDGCPLCVRQAVAHHPTSIHYPSQDEWTEMVNRRYP